MNQKWFFINSKIINKILMKFKFFGKKCKKNLMNKNLILIIK